MVTENVAAALGIARAQAALRKQVDGPLAAGHGIGFTAFEMLAELDAVQGNRLRVTDLAQRLRLTAGGVTRAARALESAGYVERAGHDRDARASYLVLTASGRRCFEHACATIDRIVGAAFAAALTRAERLTLLGAFERLGY